MKTILSNPVKQRFSTWEKALRAAEIHYMSYGWFMRAFGVVIIRHWVDHNYFSVINAKSTVRERQFYYD
jgi:hypothetical protein